jgi:hypothetical protein
MNKIRTAIFFAALLFCLVGTGAALAMSSANYNLPWDVLSGGGGDRGSSSYALSDTVGQPSAIGLSQSTNYQLGGGFWYGVSPTTFIPGDANEDGVINVLDMTEVARIILLLDPETPGADCNLDGSINVIDMTCIARIILGLD